MVVFNANGFAVASSSYTHAPEPTIESIDPPAGNFKGGDTVTITVTTGTYTVVGANPDGTSGGCAMFRRDATTLFLANTLAGQPSIVEINPQTGAVVELGTTTAAKGSIAVTPPSF